MNKFYFSEHKNAIIWIVIVSLVVYAAKFFNVQFLPDDLFAQGDGYTADHWLNNNGRWAAFLFHRYIFSGELTYFPYLSSVIGMAAYIVAAYVTCVFFDVRRPVYVVIAALLILLSPYTGDNVNFSMNMPTAPLGVMLAMLALCFMYEYKRGWLWAYAMFVAAFGLYQTILLAILIMISVRWLMQYELHQALWYNIQKILLPILVTGAAMASTMLLNKLMINWYIGADGGGRRFEEALSTNPFDLLRILDHALIKTEPMWSRLVDRQGLYVLLGVLTVAAIALVIITLFVLLTDKVLQQTKRKILVVVAYSLFVLAAIGVIMAHEKDLLFYKPQILVLTYTIFVIGFFLFVKHALEQVQQVDLNSLFRVAAIILFVGLLPFIIFLPVFFGQSLGVRSHFSIAWLTAVSFILIMNYGGELIKKTGLVLSVLLLIYGGVYASLLLYRNHQHSMHDIASAISMVTLIRATQGYESVQEPVELKLVGGRVPSPESSEYKKTRNDMAGAYAIAVPWSKYELIELYTDFQFEQMSEDRWQVLKDSLANHYDQQPLYPQPGSIVFEGNSVIVYMAPNDQTFAFPFELDRAN